VGPERNGCRVATRASSTDFEAAACGELTCVSLQAVIGAGSTATASTAEHLAHQRQSCLEHVDEFLHPPDYSADQDNPSLEDILNDRQEVRLKPVRNNFPALENVLEEVDEPDHSR